MVQVISFPCGVSLSFGDFLLVSNHNKTIVKDHLKEAVMILQHVEQCI